MESKLAGNLAFGHPWRVNLNQAKDIQSKLSSCISLKDDFDEIEKIVGIGIAFSEEKAKVSAVEFSFPQLAIKNQFSMEKKIFFPYTPNFFAFSVGPIIFSLMKKIEKPYIALFPGRGIAHPRRLGLASHLGLLLDVPSVTCSKSLWKEYPQIDLKKGNYYFMRDSLDNIEGAVVVTKDHTKPVFVSCGHRVSLETAICITLKCAINCRVPEPLRIASILAKQE
jgi:deoxyribonuclease V